MRTFTLIYNNVETSFSKYAMTVLEMTHFTRIQGIVEGKTSDSKLIIFLEELKKELPKGVKGIFREKTGRTNESFVDITKVTLNKIKNSSIVSFQIITTSLPY